MLIYFAGPDVFRPDFVVWAGYVHQLCTNHGWTALIPHDTRLLEPREIFAWNFDALTRSDVVVANGNPFRGCELDSGTAFEIGAARAFEKQVITYVNQATSLVERVERGYGPLTKGVGWALLDRDGYGVENHSLPMNLMPAMAGDVVIGGVAVALNHLATKVEIWKGG